MSKVDINKLTAGAIDTIRKMLPDVIIPGQLVSYAQTMDPATARMVNAVSKSLVVECIYATAVQESESSDFSLSDRLTVYILGFEAGHLFDYQYLIIGGEQFSTAKISETRIGGKVPLRIFEISR